MEPGAPRAHVGVAHRNSHSERVMIGSIHVVPRGETWGVLREGDDEEIVSYMMHADALQIGRDIARQERAELVIHDVDGAIRGLDFYGAEAPTAGSTA